MVKIGQKFAYTFLLVFGLSIVFSSQVNCAQNEIALYQMFDNATVSFVPGGLMTSKLIDGSKYQYTPGGLTSCSFNNAKFSFTPGGATTSKEFSKPQQEYLATAGSDFAWKNLYEKGNKPLVQLHNQQQPIQLQQPQPQYQQSTFQPVQPQQLSVVSGKPNSDQKKARDTAIENYKKIVSGVASNVKDNKENFFIKSSLSEYLTQKQFNYIAITKQKNISFIQYLDDNDVNNDVKQRAVGDAMFLSLLLNRNATIELVVNRLEKKLIQANTIPDLDSFNNHSKLSNDLTVQQYIGAIKKKKKEARQNDEDYNVVWHTNNIVVLHSFDITSECDYVELFARLKKLRTSISDAFVLIVEQKDGNPFQVLINKFENKIDILTTQKITDKFKSFIINLFGEDKVLENKIMELESKKHENSKCLIAVLKEIGLDIEDIDKFLKINSSSATMTNPSSVITQTSGPVVQPQLVLSQQKNQSLETKALQQIISVPVKIQQAPKTKDWKSFLKYFTALKFDKLYNHYPKATCAMAAAGAIVTLLVLSKFLSLLFSDSFSSSTVVQEFVGGGTFINMPGIQVGTYPNGSSFITTNNGNGRWH